MQIEEFFGVVAVLAFFGLLIFIPIRFFMLIGEVKALEKRVQALAERTPVDAPKSVPAATPVVAVAPVAAAPAPAPVLPPPLPARSAPVPSTPSAPAVAQPDPLFERL